MQPRWVRSTGYAQVLQSPVGNDDVEEAEEIVKYQWVYCFGYLKIMCYVLSFVFAGFIGYLIGLEAGKAKHIPPVLADTVPRVSIGWSRKTFVYDEKFSTAPPASGTAEPEWDSLIPNGLGYVRYPASAANLSVVSAFHQLHCLYTLRRAYYSTSEPGLIEDFDFGHDRNVHVKHCFEYIRQSLICSADSSIEPASPGIDGFLGWDFGRQCRNYEELKDWAEQSRAFDGHGFLAADLLHNHRNSDLTLTASG
ncbi:hypothetical protein MMC25_004524 [Agyrium rufum]|nr:hypothetical protein [Agyrium rufum]